MFEIAGITGTAVELALDAAVLRHVVISNNLANVRTPGFAPKRLDFEEQLRAVGVGLWSDENDDTLRGRLDHVRDQMTSPAGVRSMDHGPVEIDVEMVQLAENTVRYQALLEGISKRGAIIRTAVNEGRI